jgi:hypothetical protein
LTDAPAPLPLDILVAAVARELAMRERVYPDWVRNKKMTAEKRDHEIAAMRGVLDWLLGRRWAEPNDPDASARAVCASLGFHLWEHLPETERNRYRAATAEAGAPRPGDDAIEQIARMRLFPDDGINRTTLLAAIQIARKATGQGKITAKQASIPDELPSLF